MQGKFFITAALQAVIIFNASAMDLQRAEPKVWKASAITETSCQSWSVKADLSFDNIIVLRAAQNPNTVTQILYEKPEHLSNLPDLLKQAKDEHYQIISDPSASGEFNIAALKNYINTNCTQESRWGNLIQVTNNADSANQRVFNIVGLVTQDKQKDNKEFLRDSKSEIRQETPATSTTTTTASSSSSSKKPILLGVGVTFVAVLIAFLQYKGYIKIPYIS